SVPSQPADARLPLKALANPARYRLAPATGFDGDAVLAGRLRLASTTGAPPRLPAGASAHVPQDAVQAHAGGALELRHCFAARVRDCHSGVPLLRLCQEVVDDQRIRLVRHLDV